MSKILSAGGVVYYNDKKTGEPHFLVIKRYAVSKKIEWIAPKGKIQNGETEEQAAVREISEEVGLAESDLLVKKKLKTLSLQLYTDDGILGVDKDITYFLVEHIGDPSDVDLLDGEGFMGVRKRAPIKTILNLVTYKDLRELYRDGYKALGDISVKNKFIQSL